LTCELLVHDRTKKGEGLTFIVGLFTAVLTTEVGVVARSVGVAVLDPTQSCRSQYFVLRELQYKTNLHREFLETISMLFCIMPICSRLTCSKVKAEIRLSAYNLTPLEKLIRAKLITLGANPGKFRSIHSQFSLPAISQSEGNSPSRPLLLGTNTILPMIRRNKVTAGIPHDRAVQLLHGLDDIFAEAVLIGQGVSGVVDATVDAATHVSGDVSMDEEVWGLLVRHTL
jgi:hypothetical protein